MVDVVAIALVSSAYPVDELTTRFQGGQGQNAVFAGAVNPRTRGGERGSVVDQTTVDQTTFLHLVLIHSSCVPHAHPLLNTTRSSQRSHASRYDLETDDLDLASGHCVHSRRTTSIESPSVGSLTRCRPRSAMRKSPGRSGHYGELPMQADFSEAGRDSSLMTQPFIVLPVLGDRSIIPCKTTRTRSLYCPLVSLFHLHMKQSRPRTEVFDDGQDLWQDQAHFHSIQICPLHPHPATLPPHPHPTPPTMMSPYSARTVLKEMPLVCFGFQHISTQNLLQVNFAPFSNHIPTTIPNMPMRQMQAFRLDLLEVLLG